MYLKPASYDKKSITETAIIFSYAIKLNYCSTRYYSFCVVLKKGLQLDVIVIKMATLILLNLFVTII